MSDDDAPAEKRETTSAADNSPPHDASANTPETPQDNGPRTSIASSPPILPPSRSISATIEGNSDETSRPISGPGTNHPTNPVTPTPKTARRTSPRIEVPSSPPAGHRSDMPHWDTEKDVDDSVVSATPDPAEVKLPSSPPLPSVAGQKRRAEDEDTRENTKVVRMNDSEADLEGGFGAPAAGQTPTEFTKRLQREKSKTELEKSMKVSADHTAMEGVDDDGKMVEQDAVDDDSNASTILQEQEQESEPEQEQEPKPETSSYNDTLMEETKGGESAAEE